MVNQFDSISGFVTEFWIFLPHQQLHTMFEKTTFEPSCPARCVCDLLCSCNTNI